MEKSLYIGLMSGTSADGVDAAMIRCHDGATELLHSVFVPMPAALRRDILSLCRPGEDEIRRTGAAECQLANLFAECALQVAGEHRHAVRAIGSHGQTIRHHAEEALPYTVQIGDPSRIAELTGITVVADFRRRDIAAGGQGAPLAPAFHRALFGAPESRAVLNLGGMANLTLLPATGPILGFDTGPGNALLDFWAERHLGRTRDDGGQWAASGKTDDVLLRTFLADPYFSITPPKSTGRERFHGAWLAAHLAESGTKPDAVDVQATLSALTAETVCDALLRNAPGTRRLLVSGGGVHNADVMAKLSERLSGISVESTADHGVDPDMVEAVGFAWLAHQTLEGQPGNIPEVTGARGPRVLGGIYQA